MANIAPIQTGDGSEEATASAFRPGSFGPSPTPDLRTNVAAPLDVRGAPSQASFLAAQLQQSLETMRWPMMTAERVQGMQHARQMEQQGTADAMSGNIDPNVEEADSSYRSGAVRVVAQKAAIKAVQGWSQFAQDPQNGIGQMGPQQLLATMDGYFRKQLGGLERDPMAAAAIEPLIAHTMNETVGRVTNSQITEKFNDGLANASALAENQASHGGASAGITGAGVFNYGQQLDTLTALAAGNRAYAKGQLDQALVQTAVAQKNTSILDLIQTAPGQNAIAPKTQLLMSEARTTIERANKEAQAQYTQAQSFGVLAGWDQQLAGKTPVPFSQINQAVQQHRITQEQGLEYYQRSLTLGEQLDRQAGASNILASGQPWWDAVGTPKADGKAPYTKQDFTNANDAAIDKLPQEQRDTAAIMRTRQYGLVYSPLAARVNSEPVTTAQGVKDVLSTYNSMNSTDAGVTGQYFSDPKRLAEVHQMLTLRQSGMGDADIATYMQKSAGPQSPEAVGVKAADINKALGTSTFQSGHFWNGGPVDMATIANPGQVQQRALALAHQMAASGSCTGATCATAAAKAVIDQSYVIKLSGGNHSLVIPRAVSDPPTSQSQPALQYWYDNALPGIAKATGHDAFDMRLVPNPSQPGSYTLTDSTGLPVSEQTFTLPAIVAYWQKGQGDAVRAKQQTAAATAARSAQGQAAAINSEVNLIGR